MAHSGGFQSAPDSVPLTSPPQSDATVAPTPTSDSIVAPVPPLPSKLAMGSTGAGADWVRKALHPADHEIKAVRMAFNNTRPSVAQALEHTFVLDAPAASDELYNLDIWLIPDWHCPMIAHAYDSNSSLDASIGHHKFYQFWNPATAPASNPGGLIDDLTFTSSDFSRMAQHLPVGSALAEEARLTYLSLTGEFTGASLADQGTVMATQYVDPTVRMTYFAPHWPDGLLSNAAGQFVDSEFFALCAMAEVSPNPLPSERSVSNAAVPYIAKAKEGFYVPYKMQHPGNWVRCDEPVYRLRSKGTSSAAYPGPRQSYYKQGDKYRSFFGGEPDGHTPQAAMRPLDDGIAYIAVRGISRTSSFRATIRQGMELICTQDSQLIPYALPAPLEDHLSQEVYRQVAVKMVDGYPARYNGLGLLLPVVGRVFKSVAKTVLAGIGQHAATAAGKGLMQGGKMLKLIGKAPKQEPKQPSARATAIQRTKEAQAKRGDKPLSIVRPAKKPT